MINFTKLKSIVYYHPLFSLLIKDLVVSFIKPMVDFFLNFIQKYFTKLNATNSIKVTIIEFGSPNSAKFIRFIRSIKSMLINFAKLKVANSINNSMAANYFKIE